MSSMRHVRIRGRVQAVGFRAWTQSVALRRGVEGWVRNRRDGSVEAVFAGRGRCGCGNDHGLPARAAGLGGRGNRRA